MDQSLRFPQPQRIWEKCWSCWLWLIHCSPSTSNAIERSSMWGNELQSCNTYKVESYNRSWNQMIVWYFLMPHSYGKWPIYLADDLQYKLCRIVMSLILIDFRWCSLIFIDVPIFSISMLSYQMVVDNNYKSSTGAHPLPASSQESGPRWNTAADATTTTKVSPGVDKPWWRARFAVGFLMFP